MMKKIIFLVCVMFSFEAYSQASKIQAIVNGDIVTTSDLDSRLDTFLFMSKMPLNPQTTAMAQQQVLHQAIDEVLKLQEAEKNGITIAKEDIANSFKQFEEKYGSIKDNNLSKKAIEEQIKADLAWARLINMKSFETKQITQKEIETALESAIKDINSPKRMVSEIYILKKKAKNLSELVETLRKDDRFELYAMQFSDAPSAGKGGKLGWINVGRFEPVIEKTLSKMQEGEISDPVLSGNGYYILKLEKNFDPKKEKAYRPSKKEMENFLQNKKMELFVQNYMQNIRQNATIELR